MINEKLMEGWTPLRLPRGTCCHVALMEPNGSDVAQIDYNYYLKNSFHFKWGNRVPLYEDFYMRFPLGRAFMTQFTDVKQVMSDYLLIKRYIKDVNNTQEWFILVNKIFICED